MRCLCFIPFIILFTACNNAASFHQPEQVNSVITTNFPAVSYPWMETADSLNTIHNRFACPEGYKRVTAEPGSFGEWLRHLPLLAAGHEVLLYNGEKKNRQDVH